MIAALISGSLFRPPEQRTAKSGKPFIMASVKIKDGDSIQFVRLFAFSESAQAELARLAEGDALTAQGSLKAEVYEANGEHRVSLTLIADAVLPLRRERKPKTEASNQSPQDARSKQQRCAGRWRDERDGPNDSLDGLEVF
jgi:Single-strand binding protein family